MITTKDIDTQQQPTVDDCFFQSLPNKVSLTYGTYVTILEVGFGILTRYREGGGGLRRGGGAGGGGEGRGREGGGRRGGGGPPV